MSLGRLKEEKYFEDESGNRLIVVREFPIAHVGWECDSHGYVVIGEDGKHILILTDHGSPYIAKKEELASQLYIYNNLIETTNEVLSMLPDDPEEVGEEDAEDN